MTGRRTVRARYWRNCSSNFLRFGSSCSPRTWVRERRCGAGYRRLWGTTSSCRMPTLMSNIFTDMNLSDMETCYKVFRREILQAIPIEENRFGFEPEITVKIAKRRLRVYEVGISYWGRTYEEGKKIGWKDGVRAVYCLVKYSLKEPVVQMETAIAPASHAVPR